MFVGERYRVPKRLKIGGSSFSVQPRSASWREKNKAIGMMLRGTKQILYDKTQPKEQIVYVMLHEILHAVIHEYSIRMKNHPMEERIVTEISSALHEVIEANPHLLRWMAGVLHHRVDKVPTE